MLRGRNAEDIHAVGLEILGSGALSHRRQVPKVGTLWIRLSDLFARALNTNSEENWIFLQRELEKLHKEGLIFEATAQVCCRFNLIKKLTCKILSYIERSYKRHRKDKSLSKLCFLDTLEAVFPDVSFICFFYLVFNRNLIKLKRRRIVALKKKGNNPQHLV